MKIDKERFDTLESFLTSLTIDISSLNEEEITRQDIYNKMKPFSPYLNRDGQLETNYLVSNDDNKRSVLIVRSTKRQNFIQALITSGSIKYHLTIGKNSTILVIKDKDNIPTKPFYMTTAQFDSFACVYGNGEALLSASFADICEKDSNGIWTPYFLGPSELTENNFVAATKEALERRRIELGIREESIMVVVVQFFKRIIKHFFEDITKEPDKYLYEMQSYSKLESNTGNPEYDDREKARGEKGISYLKGIMKK